MIKGGQRIATATGVMLADPHSLGNARLEATDALFEPEFWMKRGELATVSQGRGSAWFIGGGEQRWVLRHFRRGGLMTRLSQDRYAWMGEDRVRAFAEWRLLEQLVQWHLPVPKPIAARYQRAGLTYRCDLITLRIPLAQPLSLLLAAAALPDDTWRAIGATLARLRDCGVDHADLNAHNILIAEPASVSVIDFDRGVLRAPGSWPLGNLKRLQRSLLKIAGALPSGRFTPSSWDALLTGYRAPR
jgi:3-deoxy-D-manno-octulosonic acid kinase